MLCVEPVTEVIAPYEMPGAAANHGLLVQLNRQIRSAVRRPCSTNRRAYASPRGRCPEPAKSTAPGMLLAAGFGVVGEKSAQRSFSPVGGNCVSQRSPRFIVSFGVIPPVILHIAGEVRELLADEANRVQTVRYPRNPAAARRTDCRRRWRSWYRRRAGFREAEAHAAGLALAAEAVVVRQLVHAAGLEGVRSRAPT